MAREVRPRFQIRRDEAVEVLLSRIDVRLRAPGCPLGGYVAEDRAVLYIPRARQRFWSAELRIEAVRRDSDTVLEGTYAPHPHVWITYFILLAAVIVGITVAVVLALAQWSMNERPMALWALVPLVLIGAVTYAAAFVGQGFATDEVDELRAFIDAALETDAMPSLIRNLRPGEDEGSNVRVGGLRMRRSLAATALLVLTPSALFGCGDEEESPSACSFEDVLVSGRVVRVRPNFSFNEDVAFAAGSVARITLYSNPALGGDGASTPVATQTLSPPPEAPFDFCIRGFLDAPVEPGFQYHVAAEIKQRANSGTVGDLMSETILIVNPPETGVTVEVSGLESCQSAAHGGACL